MHKSILFDVDGTLLPMDVHEFVKYYFGSLSSQRAAGLCKPGLRRCGEIGRHEGLKIPFWRQSTGSTPVGGM